MLKNFQLYRPLPPDPLYPTLPQTPVLAMSPSLHPSLEKFLWTLMPENLDPQPPKPSYAHGFKE